MDEQNLLLAIGKMLDDRLKPIETDLSLIKERTQRLEVLLENEIPHQIRIIGEQHSSIIEKLDALADYPETRGRVSTLENVVKSHTNAIAEMNQKAI